MAPMIAQADMAVVTKTDLVSQAEKEVFREYIKEVAPSIDIIETNATQGTGMRYLMKALAASPDLSDAARIVLRGSPPLESVHLRRKKEIGWQHHFGVIRPLEEADGIYRGDWVAWGRQEKTVEPAERPRASNFFCTCAREGIRYEELSFHETQEGGRRKFQPTPGLTS